MNKDQKHYETVDIPLYRAEIEPRLPKEILDFHVHLWKLTQWKTNPYKENKKSFN